MKTRHYIKHISSVLLLLLVTVIGVEAYVTTYGCCCISIESEQEPSDCCSAEMSDCEHHLHVDILEPACACLHHKVDIEAFTYEVIKQQNNPQPFPIFTLSHVDTAEMFFLAIERYIFKEYSHNYNDWICEARQLRAPPVC